MSNDEQKQEFSSDTSEPEAETVHTRAVPEQPVARRHSIGLAIGTGVAGLVIGLFGGLTANTLPMMSLTVGTAPAPGSADRPELGSHWSQPGLHPPGPVGPGGPGVPPPPPPPGMGPRGPVGDGPAAGPPPGERPAPPSAPGALPGPRVDRPDVEVPQPPPLPAERGAAAGQA